MKTKLVELINATNTILKENNTILKEYVLKAISELRTKKKRPDNNSICEYINKKLDTNSRNENIFTIILSLVDENIITNKPTKQGLPSYFILNEENDNEEEEKEDENSNDDFNFDLLGTTSVDKSIKDNTDSRNEPNVKCDQHNLISKDVDEISFLKQSILNINAEIMAIKNFVMDELYSFNQTLDRVRTEQCDQTKFMKDMKNLTDENTKTLIIKILTENMNTINKEKFITNNQNLNKDKCQDSTNNNSFKYPKWFASLPRKSNLTNAAEGINVSPNPFQLLEHNNIQYTILDENDSNAHNTMMNPIINTNDNIQVVKRRPAVVINNHPENQNQFKNIATVPGEKTYSETVRGRYKPSTLIFSDSIPKKTLNTNKEFWNLVRPFLTNKGTFSNDFITIKDKDRFVDDEGELVELFNNHYINIVEKTSGKPPENSFGNYENNADIVNAIIKKNENHPSILKINENFTPKSTFQLPRAEVSDINKLLKGINIKKTTGPDTIPPKLGKLSADVIDSHLCNIINLDIDKNDFSDGGKIASVRPMFKKKPRQELENYRPVSILNTFSKIYERYIHNSLTPFVDNFLSVFISAYRKTYSSNHVLIRLIENWKQSLDRKKFVGGLLMDLSKAFDCIPHELLIAKMHAYGFELNTLVFFYCYLKNRKQNVKINNTYSVFQVLLSGVPQGSILGPILFNIFINDLLMNIENSELHNFADDNTISCSSETLRDLITNLEIESNKAAEWFKVNNMIVNPDKFQSIIIDRKGQTNNPTKLTIDGSEISSENSVTLLGLEIDSKLNFDKHISKLCNKCAGILNALCRIKRFLAFNERKILVNSFIYGNFNYCPLV